MGLCGEGQSVRQSPHLSRQDATRISGLSTSGAIRDEDVRFQVAGIHWVRLRSYDPQRIVSLQNLIDLILVLRRVEVQRYRHHSA
jgi:hypothetical protein